ncbi:hypothetical protein OAD28_01360 [Flavobacteriales bacterium]|nr:hypothetical protein [Flavobacteriales bacterium]
MNDLTQTIDKLFSKLSENKQNLFIENRFPYLMSKAFSLLEEGAEKYRKSDAFDMPNSYWNNLELKLVFNGCKQIIKGSGLDEDDPFRNLGVAGLINLFSTFHFNSVKRKSKRIERGKILDIITFEHKMDSSQITVYNLVEYKS